MKRTCAGCKALNDSDQCQLKHPIRFVGEFSVPAPMEECEKPITFDHFYRCMNAKYVIKKGNGQ
jgi:hypothetical protein